MKEAKLAIPVILNVYAEDDSDLDLESIDIERLKSCMETSMHTIMSGINRKGIRHEMQREFFVSFDKIGNSSISEK